MLANQTFDELYSRQEQRPWELSDRDLKTLAARYGSIVREVAGKLSIELCESIAARERLDKQRLGQVRSAVKEYIRELTSAASTKSLLNTTVVQYFTIAEHRKAKERLAKYMKPASFRKLLEKNAREELDYAKAKYHVKEKSRQGKRHTSALPAKILNISRYLDAARLTDRQKEVLSLQFEYGVSISEIARRLGLHRKTVQESLARGRLKLDRASGIEHLAKRRAITEPGNLS